MKNFSVWKTTLKIVFVILILFLMIGPLVGIVLWSFAMRWYWPSPVPQDFTLRYWIDVFKQGRVLDSIILSSVIALITVGLSLLFAIPAAYGFARYKIPAERLFLTLFLMPQAFPQLPIFINLAGMILMVGPFE